MIPAEEISNPEVREFAREAEGFLMSHAWCTRVESVHLAWAIAGILGVFKVQLTPAQPNIDEVLWVIVGDLPPAYLVTDDAKDWREALGCYVYEMRQWVEAIRNKQVLDDIIPVDVEPTLEHADLLESRLVFIEKEILASDQEVASDT